MDDDTNSDALRQFLLARFAEDYDRERASELHTPRERGAYARWNARRACIGTAVTMAQGRLVPFEIAEAAKYGSHRNFRSDWLAWVRDPTELQAVELV